MRSFFFAVSGILIVSGTVFAQSTAASKTRGTLFGESFPVFAHVNIGSQFGAQDLGQTAEFPLYDEAGSWEAGHQINRGRTFDIGGGVGLVRLTPVLRRFFVGLTYTVAVKQTREVNVNAQVPHPIFTDTIRSASVTVPGIEHSERAVHIQALYQLPVTADAVVTLFAGPTIFTVREEFISSVTPMEAGGDFSSVAIESASTPQRKRAGGFHLGIDSRYVLLRNLPFIRDLGVGAMVRYSRGRLQMALPGGSEQTLDAGGPEFSAGLRLRF